MSTEPQWIWTQTRRPSRDGEDPGAIEEGWFYAENGKVYLCDKAGVKTGTSKALRRKGYCRAAPARRDRQAALVRLQSAAALCKAELLDSLSEEWRNSEAKKVTRPEGSIVLQ